MNLSDIKLIEPSKRVVGMFPLCDAVFITGVSKCHLHANLLLDSQATNLFFCKKISVNRSVIHSLSSEDNIAAGFNKKMMDPMCLPEASKLSSISSAFSTLPWIMNINYTTFNKRFTDVSCWIIE